MERLDKPDKPYRITKEAVEIFCAWRASRDYYERISLHSDLCDALGTPPWLFPCIVVPREICVAPIGSDEAMAFATARTIYEELMRARAEGIVEPKADDAALKLRS